MIEGMKSLYVVSLCPTETDHSKSNILPFAISLAQQSRAHLSIEMAAMRIVVPSAGPSSTISGLVTSENRRLLGLAQEYARQAHADATAAGVPATAQPVHMSYSDFVAERACAFGRLALMLDCMKDDHAKELTRTMLKAIIRSIRTPPGGDLVEWPRN